MFSITHCVLDVLLVIANIVVGRYRASFVHTVRSFSLSASTPQHPPSRSHQQWDELIWVTCFHIQEMIDSVFCIDLFTKWMYMLEVQQC